MKAKQTSQIVLRKIDRGNASSKDVERQGRCRVCFCTFDRACPSNCGWANARETLCTSCAAFTQLSRREVADLLFAAGYLSTSDLRVAGAELEEAIGDFNTVLEALRDRENLKGVTFACRSWKSEKDMREGLAAEGLEIATGDIADLLLRSA